MLSPNLFVSVFALKIVGEESSAFTRHTEALLPAGNWGPARETEKGCVRETERERERV